MTASLPAVFNVQLLTDTGTPASGFRLYTYSPGTTVHKIAYTDAAATTPHTYTSDGIGGQFIALNSRGELPAGLYLTAGGYDLALKNAAGATVWTRRATAVDDTSQALLSVFSGDDGSSFVGFLQTGAQPRSVESKLRDLVSILDFIPEAEHAGIAAGSSSYDCYPAIMAAVNSATYLGTFLAGPYRAGPAIYFPPGVYTVSQTIHLKKRVSLLGDGSGKAYGDAAILKWPADTAGIVFHHLNTDATGTVASTTAAAASVIRGLALVSAGGSLTQHGLWARTRISIENVYIENFPGDGIHIRATAGGGGFDEGNANSWSIIGGRVNDCGGNGLFVDGADANAGLCLGLDSMANGGWGFYDSSFLGNSYEGCHTASNTLGGYKTDNANAASVFNGCYSEGGQPGDEVVYPSMSIGGTKGSGFAVGNTAPHIAAGGDGLRIENAPINPLRGVNFTGVTATGNANTLDRYREGSWTPTPTGLTVVGTASYQGRYTVIGNTVYFTIEVSVSGGTTAATAGTTSFTLPSGYAPLERDTAMVVDTAIVDLGTGLVDTAAGGSVKPPSWAARAATVVISGQYRIASV